MRVSRGHCLSLNSGLRSATGVAGLETMMVAHLVDNFAVFRSTGKLVMMFTGAGQWTVYIQITA
jgi:hypothetical protein